MYARARLHTETMSLPKLLFFSALLLVLSYACDSVNVHAMPTAATPVSNNTITLPITKHFNFTGSAGKILQHDQARIRALHARGIASATGTAPPLTPDVGNIPIENALATYNVIVSNEIRGPPYA